MILKEASESIGKLVCYSPHNWENEYGTIFRVNDTYVFVLYEGDINAKATHPKDLTFVSK